MNKIFILLHAGNSLEQDGDILFMHAVSKCGTYYVGGSKGEVGYTYAFEEVVEFTMKTKEELDMFMMIYPHLKHKEDEYIQIVLQG